MATSSGIHHITAIAGDARANRNFYTRDLGMRMVKRTVNQDDPGTYHLYYGNAHGAPGTVLTFFPWAHAAPGRHGSGQAEEVGLAVPKASIGWWSQRLTERGIQHSAPERRFGETAIAFADPDGLKLEIVGTDWAGALPGWATSHESRDGVPAEHSVRGFSGVSLWLADPAPTAEILTGAFGFARIGEEAGRVRYSAGEGLAGSVDIRVAPDEARGRLGRGTIHHVAFRASDDADEFALREAITARGLEITEQIDRFYFRSMYFREPGHVLFELATDAPGFSVDEAPESLGEALVLPPWLESKRREIEDVLPALD